MLAKLDFSGWENNTPWCVPTAVSLVSGVPVAHMHSRAAFIQNKAIMDVKGVFWEEAILMLREQGYKASMIDIAGRFNGKPPTIRSFLASRTKYEYCMPIMFSTMTHMMAAQYGFVADNWTKKAVPIEEFPKLSREVTTAYIVMKY
jgi:hypothetical protein